MPSTAAPPLQGSLALEDRSFGSSARRRFVRELCDADTIDCAFLLRARNLRERRNGEPFLKLTLADKTGSVDGVIWENAAEAYSCLEPGSVVWVQGRYSLSERYGGTVTVRKIERLAEAAVDMSELVEASARGIADLELELERLIGSIGNHHLRRLLQVMLDRETETGRRYRVAPAAKLYHEAYRHGLLEHSLSVAQGTSAVANCFPRVNRDLAVAGALLHDIGKTVAYQYDQHLVDLSDLGRLQGEIPLGYYLIRRTIEDLDDFPAELAKALLHIILAHHGSLEHGSPVAPCTREAMLVRMIDNLGGRLGSFDRLEKGLAADSNWSEWDRALSGPAYFGSL